MKILHLTLSKKPFDVMVVGEKTVEYRKPTHWLLSRLYDKNRQYKQYDTVKFVNGYGNDKPYFIAKLLFSRIALERKEIHYSNGLIVVQDAGDYLLYLGDIIETGNLK